MTTGSEEPTPIEADAYLRQMMREEFTTLVNGELASVLEKFRDNVLADTRKIQEETMDQINKKLGVFRESQNGKVPKIIEKDAPTQVSDALSSSLLTDQFKANPIASIMAVGDYLFEKAIKIIELKNNSQDPFGWAEKLKLQKPALAEFIGQTLAPDPLEQHIPAMLARAGIGGYDAGLRVRAARERPHNPLVSSSNGLVTDDGEAPKPATSNTSLVVSGKYPRRNYFAEFSKQH